jgi:rare lipoprotein A
MADMRKSIPNLATFGPFTVAPSEQQGKVAMINSKSFRVCAVAFISAGASHGAAQAACGTASWYHEGAKTANGERYRPDGISAAHKTLPFGTKVLVRNQRTGRTVTVRINDRGPFIRGRIIDLSRGAKQVIGMDGLASVCLTVLGRGERYADAGDTGTQRVSKKSRRAVREVYRTTQTSARWDDDAGDEYESRPVRKQRSVKLSNSRNVAQRRQIRENREYRASREATQERAPSFNLANWPQTSDGRL